MGGLWIQEVWMQTEKTHVLQLPTAVLTVTAADSASLACTRHRATGGGMLPSGILTTQTLLFPVTDEETESQQVCVTC